MTFYLELLCETGPIQSGEITEAELRAAVRLGFLVREDGFEIRPSLPDLSGGMDKNPLDGVGEAQAVFRGLSGIDCGSPWGLSANEPLRFDQAFSAYANAIGRLRPGTLVGYWEWLTGPAGDEKSPRFRRLVFDSLPELLNHEATRNEVLLVRTG